jgi:hypothetical protein
MSDFIDYVYCQGVDGYQTKHLFQTKAWSGIEAGNIVFAAGCGVAAFTVIAVITIEKGSELEAFVRTLCGGDEVRRLTGKIVVLECEED